MNKEQIIKKSFEKYPINNVRNSLGYMYDENRDKREGYIQALTEIESMPMVKGWLVRDWIGNFLCFFRKGKPITKREGRWEDNDGLTGEILGAYCSDKIDDLTWDSVPVEAEIIIRTV